jgi:ATP-dependent helicase/nuclease subunit A
LAERIARQIKSWLDEGMMLASKGRPIAPGDIMILLRKRGDLARLIVARLYEAGVPVAGVDRLRLQAPLGVQDLVAALRFAAQPEDDLSLACLLVSPLIGWSQDELWQRAVPRKGSLWRQLRESGLTPADDLAVLYEILNKADFHYALSVAGAYPFRADAGAAEIALAPWRAGSGQHRGVAERRAAL